MALGVALSLVVAGAAQATLVNLSFSGTYDTFEGTIFGLSGAAVPYNFQITYDTTLDTNTLFFASGASLGGAMTTHEWHGYSMSGITATSLTFGSQTWTAGDLIPLADAIGVAADLWFDADISLSTPTRSWIVFFDGSTNSALELGGAANDGVDILMLQGSTLFDFDNAPGRAVSSFMTIDRSVAPVPEPATLALVALGLLAVAGCKLARRATRRPSPLCVRSLSRC